TASANGDKAPRMVSGSQRRRAASHAENPRSSGVPARQIGPQTAEHQARGTPRATPTQAAREFRIDTELPKADPSFRRSPHNLYFDGSGDPSGRSRKPRPMSV